MEALGSYETSDLTTATRRNITEGGILEAKRRLCNHLQMWTVVTVLHA
jgi:hypothetical protein